jgi:hypothetical protein
MKIFAVRIGDKYGPEYETYLEKKLSDYELVWIREPYHPDVTLAVEQDVGYADGH